MEYRAVKVIKNERLSEVEGRLWIEDELLAKTSMPGQFAMLSTKKSTTDPFLPRAISINRIERNKVAFAYQEIGKGTQALGALKEGELLFLLGPLGNTFDIDVSKKRLLLIGGGIGRAPIEWLAEHLAQKNNHITLIFGAKSSSGLGGLFEYERYENIDCKLVTDDGSLGEKGLVTDFIENLNLYDRIYACGPTPMMNEVKTLAENAKIPLQLSLEGKMACGVGVCLGCTCNTPKDDNYPKVCKDGPVFWSEEVILTW